jgi:hypothetical protein
VDVLATNLGHGIAEAIKRGAAAANDADNLFACAPAAQLQCGRQ